MVESIYGFPVRMTHSFGDPNVRKQRSFKFGGYSRVFSPSNERDDLICSEILRAEYVNGLD